MSNLVASSIACCITIFIKYYVNVASVCWLVLHFGTIVVVDHAGCILHVRIAWYHVICMSLDYHTLML